MPVDYPYVVSNNKIGPILSKIEKAAKPGRFSQEFLKNLGFGASNDRAVIPLLRRLGFLNDSGAPTEYYDQLKDATRHKTVLGDRIKALYSDLFTLNTEIQKANESEIKGAISRITGKDETSVSRYYATFKTLVSLAKFDGESVAPLKDVEVPEGGAGEAATGDIKPRASTASFHYNIQLHLPATTDVSVYNAIFKSLRDSLLLE
ncbi:MAG: DUF5343 domain-containing protein [Chthoniobacterales bacterium]|nr:DUF5343 domain-containing protein [Chthoniobacterales bacterium]